jgi:DNA-binding NarL/FixJ family response regulator
MPLSATNVIRVLLADDHRIVREGIRSTLSAFPSILIVGEAANGREAIEKTHELKPDVVLMDINMPEMDGLEATAEIHRTLPQVKVMALTVHDSEEYVLEILRIGAQAYVLKDTSPEELARAIEGVARGQAFFSPPAATVVLKQLVRKSSAVAASDLPRLSSRETQVLRLITRGLTTKDIARHLDIGTRTVETFRARLMRKMRVRNVAELTRTALLNNLVSGESVG